MAIRVNLGSSGSKIPGRSNPFHLLRVLWADSEEVSLAVFSSFPLFQKRFYPDDIKLPMLLIGGSDLFYNLVVYFFMFLLRGRFSFLYYLKSIIIPEFVYTMVISILLYLVFLKLNQKLEAHEKRRAKKFDL